MHDPKELQSYQNKDIQKKSPYQIPGLIYQEVPGDGHCLFHAVGLHVNHTQADLRSIVADHLESSIDDFRSFIQLPQGQTIENYIRAIREGNEWADHIEIEVLMRVLDRPIIVIGPNLLITNREVLEKRFNGEPIFVLYNGHNHYDAFLRVEGISTQEIINFLIQINIHSHNIVNVIVKSDLGQLLKTIDDLLHKKTDKWLYDSYHYIGLALILAKHLNQAPQVFSRLINLTIKLCIHLYSEGYFKEAKDISNKALDLQEDLLRKIQPQINFKTNTIEGLDLDSAANFLISLKTKIGIQINHNNIFFDNKIIRDLNEKNCNEHIKLDIIKNFKDAQKFGSIKQQWKNLKNLGDFYLKNKSFDFAMSYYQAANLLVEKHEEYRIEQRSSRQALELAFAECLYQLLPKSNEDEDSLIVRQICKIRLQNTTEIKEILRSILSWAYCFAKAEQWYKAWYCVKCTITWICQKNWKLDINLLDQLDLINIINRIATYDVNFFHSSSESVNAAVLSYKYDLNDMRDNLSDNLKATSELNANHLIKKFNADLRDFLKKIFEDCFRLIGPHPCKYAILALGSLARREACPYSDLEFAILVSNMCEKDEKEKNMITQYFEVLTNLVELYIIQLGETPLPPQDGIHLQFITEGVRFDEGGNVPFKNKILFGDCNTLLQNFHIQGGYDIPGDTIAANILQEADLLFGDMDLFKTYCKEIKEIFYEPNSKKIVPAKIFAEYLLEDHLNQFGLIDLQNQDTINIKNNLIRLITFSLNCLSMYFRIDNCRSSHERIDSLISLDVLPENIGYLLKQHLNIALYLRMCAHLFYRNECDYMYHNKNKYPEKFNIDGKTLELVNQSYISLLNPLASSLKKIIQYINLSLIDSNYVIENNSTEFKNIFLEVFKKDILYSLLFKLFEYHIEIKNYNEALKVYNYALDVSSQNQINILNRFEAKQKYADECLAITLIDKTIVKLLENDNKIHYENWKQALANRDYTLLPLWSEKKHEYYVESKANQFIISGLHLLGKLCQAKSNKSVLYNDIYYSILSKMPLVYRRCTVTILSNYVLSTREKDLLGELEIITPSLEGDGNRPLLKRKEKKWFAKLLLLFEYYDPKKRDEYIKSSRLIVRFSFESKIHEYLLRLEYLQAWLDNKGNFKEELRKLLDGKRIVIPISILNRTIAYAKVYPEMPGVQISVSHLVKRLSGNYLPQLLCHFIPLNNPENSYPVLFSKAAVGDTLQEILRVQRNLSAIENNLDTYYYTWYVIESLLIHPEDDKFDNIVAQSFINIENQECYRLINIDGDHAYVDPLIQRGIISKEIKVQLKSAAFCFKQLIEPLNNRAINEFVQLDWYKLLKAWLEELESINLTLTEDKITKEPGLFTSQQIKQFLAKCPDSSLLPVIFEAGTISDLCQRFWRLQAILKSEVIPDNHLMLMKLLHPRLASFYSDAFNKANNPQTRFAVLPTDYIVIKDNTNVVEYRSNFQIRERFEKSITLVDERKKKDLRSAIERDAVLTPKNIRLTELEGMYYQYCNIEKLVVQLNNKENTTENSTNTIINGVINEFLSSSPFVKEEVLKRMNFKNLSVDRQNLILNGLENISLRELHLRNCTSLTNNLLKQLLKAMPDLISLNLEGCNSISDSFFSNIFSYIIQSCYNLRKIDLSHTSISIIQYNECINIQQLNVNNCSELTVIDLPFADSLQSISVKASAKLEKITIGTLNLRLLNAEDCINLKYLNASNGVDTTMLLRGCKRLEENKNQITNILKDLMPSINYNKTNTPLFKVILIGDSDSGKSAMFHKLIDNIYRPPYSGIGVDFRFWCTTVDQNNYKFQIWDTTGHEKFRDIAASYIRECHLYMLCFDLTSRSSFEIVKGRLRDIDRYSYTTLNTIVLVGMKSDLKEQREISYKEAVSWKEQIGCVNQYFETSSKTGEGIQELFQYAARLLVKNQNIIIERKENDFWNEFNNADYIVKEKMIKKILTTKKLDFKKLSITSQNNIINELNNISLNKLHIHNCETLTDDKLKQLLKYKRNLVLLNLQGCTNIGINKIFSDNIFNYILSACPILQKIDLSNTSITIIKETKVTFVKKLILNECRELVAIELPFANNLEELSTIDCKRLEKISIETKNSISLNANQCTNLTILNVSANSKSTMSLESCSKLEKIKKSESIVTKFFKAEVPLEIEQITVTPIKNSLKEFFKVVLIGSSYSGKSAMLHRLVTGNFHQPRGISVGDFRYWNATVGKTNYGIQIWDTSGNERFSSLNNIYFKDNDLFMICYDLTQSNPSDTIENWCRYIRELGYSAPIILVGMKCDLKENRIISYEEAISLKQQINAEQYFETSSKTGEGVQELFQYAAKLLVDRQNKNNMVLPTTPIGFFKPPALNSPVCSSNQVFHSDELHAKLPNERSKLNP